MCSVAWVSGSAVHLSVCTALFSRASHLGRVVCIVLPTDSRAFGVVVTVCHGVVHRSVHRDFRTFISSVPGLIEGNA